MGLETEEQIRLARQGLHQGGIAEVKRIASEALKRIGELESENQALREQVECREPSFSWKDVECYLRMPDNGWEETEGPSLLTWRHAPSSTTINLQGYNSDGMLAAIAGQEGKTFEEIKGCVERIKHDLRGKFQPLLNDDLFGTETQGGQ